ncbi:inorganic triphosphatase [Ensifer sp. NM-2]|nr:inorganic triphosphatase [Ensifer sp. NM-2]
MGTTKVNETELKLELSPDALGRIKASPLLTGKPKTMSQRSVYFDTPDHKLRAAGFSLRIRTVDGVRTQTVKADNAKLAGLFVRPEWEFTISSDLPVLDHSTPIRSLLEDDVDALQARFDVHVERRMWLLSRDDAKIEAALDIGRVTVGDRETRFCELELELKNGSSSALFDLAQELDGFAPVRIGVLSKAARGYKLLGPAVSVFKAELVQLDKQITTAAAFQQIAQACIKQYRLNEAVLLAARDAEALHQARVSLRRLRSAFSIFKDVIADDRSEHLGSEARWLAGVLGQARDIDVLLGKTELAVLRIRLTEARDSAYDEVEATLGSQRVRAFMLGLAEWISNGPWLDAAETTDLRQVPAVDFASSALERLRKKIKRDGRAIVVVDDEERHKVRKDAKNLRYASEFFTLLFPGNRGRRRHKRFITILGELQDQLGALNDMAAGSQLLERIGLAGEPATASLIAKGNKKGLLEAAEDAYVDLVDAKRFWR